MDAHEKSTLANVVGWIALILSIIALALAWMAYNQASEENLGDMIQDQVQEAIPNNPQMPEVNNGNLNDSGADTTPNTTPGTTDDTGGGNTNTNNDTSTQDGTTTAP